MPGGEPARPRTVRHLAAAAEALGDRPTADRSTHGRSSARHRRHGRAHYSLAKLLSDGGDLTDARREVVRALKKPRDTATPTSCCWKSPRKMGDDVGSRRGAAARRAPARRPAAAVSAAAACPSRNAQRKGGEVTPAPRTPLASSPPVCGGTVAVTGARSTAATPPRPRPEVRPAIPPDRNGVPDWQVDQLNERTSSPSSASVRLHYGGQPRGGELARPTTRQRSQFLLPPPAARGLKVEPNPQSSS